MYPLFSSQRLPPDSSGRPWTWYAMRSSCSFPAEEQKSKRRSENKLSRAWMINW